MYLWRHAVMLHSAVQTVTPANCSHSQSTIVNTALWSELQLPCASFIQFLSLIYLWLITPSCGATGAGSAHAPVSLPSSRQRYPGPAAVHCQFITAPAPISHPCTGNMVDMITQLPSLYYTPNFTLIFCPPPLRLGRPHPHPAEYNWGDQELCPNL